jgi:hypothetical protein
MLRYALALLATAALVGCENSAGQAVTPRSQTELAAYAASAQYPSQTLSNSTPQLGALVEGTGGAIKVINFSNQSFSNANIWVNQSYVYQASSIAPHSVVTLPRNLFYNRSGHTLANGNVAVSSVELQTGDQVHTLLGPVME